MMPVISKRKLESYKRAEMLSQEVRRQFSSIGMRRDENQLGEFLIYWMKVTGSVKYDIPIPPKKRFGFQL
jgi:3-deoxy-D-manno-octulosonic-acid transferase